MVYQPEQCMSIRFEITYCAQDARQFFRSVRNFILDTRQVPPDVKATGLHWQVSQATSLINVRVEMSREPGNVHQGFVSQAPYIHLN